jgi:hypothetical protein
MILASLSVVISVLVLNVMVAVVFRARGHEAGYDKGYEAGRKDADNWWMGIEKEVEQAQRRTSKRVWP